MQFNFGEFVPHLRFQPNFEFATGDDYDILSVTARSTTASPSRQTSFPTPAAASRWPM